MKDKKLIKTKNVDVIPYWNDLAKAKSQQIPLVTKIPLQNIQKTSWFLTNSVLSTSFRPEFTVCENIIIKSKKIRIYLDKSERNKLTNYFGISRYWYNKTVEYLKNKENKCDYYKVRKTLLDNKDNSTPSWAFESPQRIRVFAIEDAVIATKNAKKKYLKDKTFSKIQFRSKKDSQQNIKFDVQSASEARCFVGKNAIKYRITEKIPENKTATGGQICFNKGRYFLIIPYKTTTKIPLFQSENQVKKQRGSLVAIDPGIRTFATYYSETSVGKWGVGDFNRISRLSYSIDKLISKRDLEKKSRKNKHNIQLEIDRLYWKIKDLKDELHNKLAYFLVTNFDIIAIPPYETQAMSTKLRSKTARQMMNWNFHGFVAKLKAKANEYNSEIITISEAYTSKTCSNCGKIEKNLGGKKFLTCKSCNVTIDRDLNGARGIFLRAWLALTHDKN